MRSRAALLNILANIALQIVAVLAGLVLPALMIRKYGSEINGMIGSIKQFMAYLGLVEAGVGAASMAALYGPLVAKDASLVSGIVSATRLFYRRSGYLFIGLLVALAAIYPFLVGGEVDEVLALLMVMTIGTGGVAEYFLIGKFSVLLAADQRNYVIALVQALATIVSTAAAVTLILGGAEVLLVQFASTLVMASRFFVIRRYVRSRYPQVRFRADPIYSAISARWAAFANQIASVVVFNSPILLLTIFTSLRDVSVYMVYNMVFAAVGALIGVVSTGLQAGFGQMLGDSDKKGLDAAFSNFEYVFFAAMTWAYVCAGLLIMPFVVIYSADFSDAQYYRPDVAALFVAVGIANNIRIPANVLVTAAGHFRETRSRAVLEAVINIVASLLFVHQFGMIGVLIGSLASYAFRTVDFLIYSARRLLVRPIWVTARVVVRNALFAACAVLPFATGIRIVASSYAQWLTWSLGICLWVFLVLATGNAVADRRMFSATIARLKGAV